MEVGKHLHSESVDHLLKTLKVVAVVVVIQGMRFALVSFDWDE